MKLIKKILIYSLAHLAMFGALSAKADFDLPEWLGGTKKGELSQNPGRVFPNRFSGSLPRPILFVHGIASDGYGTWGFQKPLCRNLNYVEWQYSSYEEEVIVDVQGSGTLETRTRTGYRYTAYCASGAKISGDVGHFNESKVVLRENVNFLADYESLDILQFPHLDWFPSLILEDILDNGIQKLGLSESEASKKGLAEGYEPNSTPAYLARKYNLDAAYDQSNPELGINHNGLEFYNISKADVTTTSPLTTDKTSYIHPQDQAKDLLVKFVAVLNEYYPDWQQNPEAMIDLVVHSQGGLVTRSMLQQAPRTSDVSHPLNHINHIITIDTPHLGTALPHMDRGITSVMKLADYVLNDIENRDSVRILGVGSMDFLAAEILEPVHILHENAQHLRYACNLHNPGWEPRASDVTNPLYIESQERVEMCIEKHRIPFLPNYRKVEIETACKSKLEAMVDSWYLGNDTDCSTYISELQKAGYPKAPNGRMIPMTAMYGRLNPEGFMKLLEIAKDKALEGCTTVKTALTFNDCKKKVRRLVNGIINITRDGLADEWVAHSDFAVDVSSQVGLGLFDENKHPFRKVEIVPLNPDIGVFHMDMSGLEESTGQKLPGAAWHAEQIFNVLQDKPKEKANMAAQYLLLLQN